MPRRTPDELRLEGVKLGIIALVCMPVGALIYVPALWAGLALLFAMICLMLYIDIREYRDVWRNREDIIRDAKDRR